MRRARHRLWIVSLTLSLHLPRLGKSFATSFSATRCYLHNTSQKDGGPTRKTSLWKCYMVSAIICYVLDDTGYSQHCLAVIIEFQCTTTDESLSDTTENVIRWATHILPIESCCTDFARKRQARTRIAPCEPCYISNFQGIQLRCFLRRKIRTSVAAERKQKLIHTSPTAMGRSPPFRVCRVTNRVANL
jgi:hypothetical protein